MLQNVNQAVGGQLVFRTFVTLFQTSDHAISDFRFVDGKPFPRDTRNEVAENLFHRIKELMCCLLCSKMLADLSSYF